MHDVHSSKRGLKVGAKALVLLPTPGSRLEVHCQGPFKVKKVFNDGLHYEIDIGKSHKQHRVYHINLLSKWQSRDETTSLPHKKCISPFCRNETWEDVTISDALTKDYVFSSNPSVTSVVTHQIDTGDSAPILCSPYKVPQKLKEVVNSPVGNMFKRGIIRPSASPWAFPVVVKIEKSAFITTIGLYEFLVMRFGMKTAGATIQRMMSDVVLKGFNFAGAYIDDLEVDMRTSLSQHLVKLGQVLQ